MTPEVSKVYDGCLEVIKALCAIDPPKDSPEGKLLTALAAAAEEYEKVTFVDIPEPQALNQTKGDNTP